MMRRCASRRRSALTICEAHGIRLVLNATQTSMPSGLNGAADGFCAAFWAWACRDIGGDSVPATPGRALGSTPPVRWARAVTHPGSRVLCAYNRPMSQGTSFRVGHMVTQSIHASLTRQHAVSAGCTVTPQLECADGPSDGCC